MKKLSRRKAAFVEYIRIHPGCTPQECFLGCHALLTGQAQRRGDFETEYADLATLAKEGFILKERKAVYRGRLTLYPFIPEHHELHGDNPEIY
jgi:hypothetical protein